MNAHRPRLSNMQMHTVRISQVAIVHENGSGRERIMEALKRMKDFRICSEFTDVEHARMCADWPAVDILLLECRQRRGACGELIKSARGANPQLMPLVIVEKYQRSLLYGALHAGALGCLLKDDVPSGLVDALREMVCGGSPFSSVIARYLVHEFLVLSRSPQGDLLSRRERQVFKFLSQGDGYRQIASELEISAHTVHGHVKKIYGKLKVTTRHDALIVGREHGYLEE